MKRYHAIPRGAVQQGFTLLELLVAVSLMALVMLGLGSSLMTVAQTQTRAEHKLQQVDHQRVTLQFLRSVLGSVSPRIQAAASPAGSAPASNYFQGTEQAVQWLGVMPARFGAGGRTHFKIATQASAQGQGQDLVLWLLPLALDNPVPDFRQAQPHILATGVTSVQWSYLRRHQGQNSWSSQWSHADELPVAVALQLQAAEGAWPRSVMAVHATPAMVRGAAEEPTFGGGSQ